MTKKIKFDVMLRDRFVATLRLPITFGIIKGYDGDLPIIESDDIKRYAETKLPKLKGQPYRILLCAPKEKEWR